jgi:hypothetical protein
LGFLIPNFTYAQTTLKKTMEGYELYRNGKPYYVQGLGGDVNLDLVVKIGGNSIRTWGVERAQQVLDEAQKRGLSVMLGFWLQHERHGFDYDNKDKVLKQLNYYKSIVDKFKNHPALLVWGIGNELNLQYTNPACWNAVEDIADFFHTADIGKFTEKLEWYLYEFHQILKTRQVGGSSSRPDKDYERDSNSEK